MLKRLKKLNTSVQNNVANKSLYPKIFLQLMIGNFCLLNELLESFYLVTQQCSKYISLLSSVIPQAAVLINFFIIKLIFHLVEVVLQPQQKIQQKLSKEGFIFLLTAHEKTFMVRLVFTHKSCKSTVSILILPC